MEGIRRRAIQIEGSYATYIAIDSPPGIFARMMKAGEFDISEMSLSSYLSNRVRGPFVDLPVFPFRVFRHGNIFTNRNGLKGRRIGTFLLSTDRIGLGPADSPGGVRRLPPLQDWVEGGLDTRWQGDEHPIPGIRVERAADDTTLRHACVGGDDALLGACLPPSFATSEDVVRLFADYRSIELNYSNAGATFRSYIRW